MTVTDSTDLIKQALAKIFDRVLDLFDGINMPEHKNETLCFVGLDGYKLSEPLPDGSGASARSAEVKYLIKALSKRNMSAKELAELFDSHAAEALLSCGLAVKELKRGSCSYSKEQDRHALTAEITVGATLEGGGEAESIGFSVGGEEYFFIRSFEIKNAFKTADTATIGGGIRTRAVGKKPLSITLKGSTAGSGAFEAYTSLSENLNGAPITVTVGEAEFSSMVLTELLLSGKADGNYAIEIGFTEVNEF